MILTLETIDIDFCKNQQKCVFVRKNLAAEFFFVLVKFLNETKYFSDCNNHLQK